ncbi:bifunctional homocysteine S-methyltransferase/methylenetetrahydrofolate reductase [Desulfobaculum bizertense]|uniref:bifunctional homocysteine S-methyltransferase/methylenetetrahydrofolate reductase n=1 Tax=Desulfobaculum bizertense TaxID=376490 RepID=UPI001F18393C|nr:bifunctional homocysteine S-methyltransferase/methylenetetrahydrofolate reductase [Desulfobaculum bizertense]UIJ38110.1 bifunctional homocysteine S-methyltransferase/methylenetetrahydrofolate reductase [Desulfobaculum bizertense]
MEQRLTEELKRRVVLADGAMGSRIFEKGIPAELSYDELNISHPELISEIHTEYLQAGAELLETNTFSATSLRLERFGLAGKTREINRRGAELARAAAGEHCQHRQCWIAGSMGPLGRLEEMPSAHKIAELYTEQAAALLEGGVDALILETFTRLDMLLPALEAVRKLTELPVIAQLVFTAQGSSFSGLNIEDSLRRLEDAGADVVGTNCGSGPLGVLRALRNAGTRQCPLSAFPNAGFPEQIGDRMLFNSDPSYFAQSALQAIPLGARLIGGCCGTGPAHIAALRKALDAGEYRKIKQPEPQAETGTTGEELRALPETLFSRKLRRGKKMILVELDPPKHLDTGLALEAASALSRAGVDAITIAENPLAVPRLSNTTLAGMIHRRTGSEVIVHITGRDRNLVGMQATLMGLAAEGLSNVLAVTGDPPPSGSDDVVKGVFDLRSFDLLDLIRRFNKGMNHHGDSMRLRANFCAGAAFNPNTKNKPMQVRRMERKIENGAGYFLTQPVYTKADVDAVADMTAHISAPIFLGIMPLISSRNAEFLHNEFPGITIPDDIRQRMKDAGDKGVDEGIEIAWDLVQHAWDKFAGIYIMPPFNRYAIALELMKRLQQNGMWEA